MTQLEPRDPPQHLSHSQAGTLLGCGEQYRLTRIYGIKETPAWNLVGGKAHHLATQLFDLAFEDDLYGGTELMEWLSDEVAQKRKRDQRRWERAQEQDQSVTAAGAAAGSGETSDLAPGDGGPSLTQLAAAAVKCVSSVLDLRARAKEQYQIEYDEWEAEQEARSHALEAASEARWEAQLASEKADGDAEEQVAQDVYDAEPAEGWSTVEPELAPLEADALSELALLTLEYEIAEQLRDGEAQAVPVESWVASGRKSNLWPEKENRAWWEHHLPTFLRDYAVWRFESGFRLAYLPVDGRLKPAIELNVGSSIGGIKISGYLDRVFLDPDTSEPVVFDIKTSQKEPTETSQLGLYSVLLASLGIPAPRYGRYWMSRLGTHGKEHTLTHFDLAYFQWKFQIAKNQRDRGEYIANPKFAFCSTCKVKEYCYEMNGNSAGQVPRPWDDQTRMIELSSKRNTAT